MMILRPIWILLLLILSGHIYGSDEASPIPLRQLKEFADALNIEGGTIPRQYLQNNQRWANLCVVLDRPFEDGVEWEEITRGNNYPLKETSIPSYNEAQVCMAYVTILHYYLTHSHEIAHKSLKDPVSILVQVHRNTSGPNQIKLIERLMQECHPEILGIKTDGSGHWLFTYDYPGYGAKVSYFYGVAPELLGEAGVYAEADIVLSFSLVAGFNPNWGSGSLLVPEKFIPFDLKEMIVDQTAAYAIKNHLTEALPKIIEEQSLQSIARINESFKSANPSKSHLEAWLLTAEDFHASVQYQVNGMFNPSKLPPTFLFQSAAVCLGVEEKLAGINRGGL